ncbi:MAG: ribonucleoside-diphosphate reductase subunit alpha, partial [Deltaproteobacteria bacterium]|nr:ribonucleoside-diphosphate reductase subunit alpha [Deltaproteobacteria bacterium]
MERNSFEEVSVEIQGARGNGTRPAEGDLFPSYGVRLRKSGGEWECFDPLSFEGSVSQLAYGLEHVNPKKIVERVKASLCDGATEEELIELVIQTAAALITEHPDYSRLAGRLLSQSIWKGARQQGILSFGDCIRFGFSLGLINDRMLAWIEKEGNVFDQAIQESRDWLFDYFGLKTLADRYLLRHPETRKIFEPPQYFWMRIAVALSESVEQVIELYNAFSLLEYVPSSPTLFNAGTRYEQLSSCFLLDSPADDLQSIYKRYMDVAMLSKFSGGIGLAYHRVRSRGSLIRSTNGRSNGIVPWLKTLDASVAAVNQGGKRKGACCVYLETWHADIEEFLELRDNTGDHSLRTYNLNIANWIPDLFMKRVEKDEEWTLFDPKKVPHLPDLWGEEFERAYEAAERMGLGERKVRARDLYARMMRTLAQTGNGWMTFKDRCNATCNQTAKPGNVVHLSNLCTEIVEVTKDGEVAVCNLGSINLARHVRFPGRATSPSDAIARFDWEKLARTVRLAIRQLDRVIDVNLYPIPEAATSNAKWRPVGLGVMGLQDVFFLLKLPFDSEPARALSKKIAEEIYYHALSTSADLAEEKGPHPAFKETRTAQGVLQFDLWGVVPEDKARWDALRERIVRTGLRNSLLIAIAPTATIAAIANCYECIEPQVSNIYKRETLSGDFVIINRYLVDDLEKLGLWNERMLERIKLAEGSVQSIEEIPGELRLVYRTAWELPQKSLIDMAAERAPFIDQSQSLNLFVENPDITRLSAMYFYCLLYTS